MNEQELHELKVPFLKEN